jgi:hypothetical protein
MCSFSFIDFPFSIFFDCTYPSGVYIKSTSLHIPLIVGNQINITYRVFVAPRHSRAENEKYREMNEIINYIFFWKYLRKRYWKFIYKIIDFSSHHGELIKSCLAILYG